MHECPDCGQACYCDGDDTPLEDGEFCTHFLTRDCRADAIADDDDFRADLDDEAEARST